MLIEHALLASFSTNEIEGVISVQSRTFILRHLVLLHEWVYKVVVQVTYWRFEPHILFAIIETLFQRAHVLGVALRSSSRAFTNL